MEIGLTPVWGIILEGTIEEKQAAHRAISCANPNFHVKGGSPRIYFLEGARYPAGLTPLLLRGMKDEGYQVEIVEDEREWLPYKDPTPDMFPGITLKPDQIKATKAALTKRAGFIKAGTGSGKTEIVYTIYSCLAPVRALFLVTKKTLHEQSFQRGLERLGQKVYQVRGSKEELPDKGLVVATYSTMYSRVFGQKKKGGRRGAISQDAKRWIEGVQAVFCDECHRLPKTDAKGRPGQYLSVVDAARKASYRIGFSATPLHSKDTVRNAILKGALGYQIYHYRDETRLKEGDVAIAHIHIKTVGLGDPVRGFLDYGEDLLNKALYKYPPFTAEVLAGAIKFHRHNIPTLIFTERKWYARMVERLLKRLLPPEKVARVDGDMTAKEIWAVRNRVVAEEITTLVTTQVIGEGDDIPNICGLIFACPMSSPHVLIQRLGRGDRDKRKYGRPNILYVLHVASMRDAYFSKQLQKCIVTYKKKKTYKFLGHKPLEIYNDLPPEGTQGTLPHR